MEALPPQDHVAKIKDLDNPADLATRCTSANVLMESCWFEGPKFLNDVTVTLDNNELSMLCEDDPEVRPQVAIHITSMTKDTTLKSDRFMRFSKWSVLRQALANLIVEVREFKNRRKILAKENVEGPHQPRKPINCQQPIQLPRLPSSTELKQAETVLIKTVQSENFATEIATLHSTELDEKTKNDLKKSNLYRLDPSLTIVVFYELEDAFVAQTKTLSRNIQLSYPKVTTFHT